MIYCNDDFISDGVKESFNEQVARGLNRRIMVAGPITRRMFIGRTGKIIGFGALAHFTLLAGDVFGGNNDYCTDGLAANDLCPNGTPAEGDICNPPDNPDRCADGSNSADECEGGASAEDVCYTGEGTQDICLESGGHEDGDLCQGGGATTNGQEQDTCMDDGTGDECNPETTIGGHDACREAPETPEDKCTVFNDDTCYNGTNAGQGNNGGDDWCDTTILASDACDGTDGTDATDLCAEGFINADDVCYGSASDHCLKMTHDSDRCIHGGLPDDLCPTGDPPEDVCTGDGGCSGGDQIGPEPPADDCDPPEDRCTLASPDNAE